MANGFARYLRKNMTDTERFVWARIRYRQLGGFRFRRQAPIGLLIADFVCFEAKLVLELDGGQHAEQVEADAKRTRWFEDEGFRVFRVWNNEVFDNWDGMAEAILALLTPHTPARGSTLSSPPPCVGEVAGAAPAARRVGGFPGWPPHPARRASPTSPTTGGGENPEDTDRGQSPCGSCE